MRYSTFLVISLLLANIIPVFGDDYVSPTSQEQQLYKKLLSEFERLDVEKKNVSEILETFENPLIISFPCDYTDLNNLVVSVIKTKLTRFDETQTHEEGVITGGTYTWKCTVTTSEGKITIDCDNELKINSDYLTQDVQKDPRIKKIENQIMMYHEFLHGQLMIDAIKSSEKWRDDTCNKPPGEKIDYSYSDKTHKIINPLQQEFAAQLIEQAGGKMIVKEITVGETNNGSFAKKVGSLNDFPQFVKNGISVSLRGTNLIETKFSSQDSDIILYGNLINKTESGIAWLYIFGMQPEQSGDKQLVETKIHIPDWIKKNAGWWVDGTISSTDFLKGIEYLIQQEIISIPHTEKQHSVDKIPNWVKQNAALWSEGKIDDKTFAAGIQYLISIGIISV
ncbi:MAG TPA: hypothetical protein VJJ25_03740 [Nitrosopumilaceae archaeon]|nr:hypothetical protein [Nitrosopumilaceae archaeon]